MTSQRKKTAPPTQKHSRSPHVGRKLDHSMILFASSLSDGNVHSRSNLPMVLLGGGAGRIKGGRHIRYAKDTPLTNLFLTMLEMTGVRIENFGDSTGKLELLSIA